MIVSRLNFKTFFTHDDGPREPLLSGVHGVKLELSGGKPEIDLNKLFLSSKNWVVHRKLEQLIEKFGLALPNWLKSEHVPNIFMTYLANKVIYLILK